MVQNQMAPTYATYPQGGLQAASLEEYQQAVASQAAAAQASQQAAAAQAQLAGMQVGQVSLRFLFVSSKLCQKLQIKHPHFVKGICFIPN